MKRHRKKKPTAPWPDEWMYMTLHWSAGYKLTSSIETLYLVLELIVVAIAGGASKSSKRITIGVSNVQQTWYIRSSTLQKESYPSEVGNIRHVNILDDIICR